MHALGRQILVEFYDCSQERINSSDFIESSMLEATAASGATIVSHDFHTFSPHGVSGVIVIAESHVTIHTWPEHGYAAVDIFTCGETINPWVIMKSLEAAFCADKVSSMELKRGLFDDRLAHKPDDASYSLAS